MPEGARQSKLGFGITGKDRPGLSRLASRIEDLGYDELWSNDYESDRGFGTLAVVAQATTHIDLGLGVIALSDYQASWIADEVERLALPQKRLILGIGSGRSLSVDLVRSGLVELRRRLPDCRLAVSSIMGPRFYALGGELADVVLTNWLLPDRIPWARELVAAAAREAHRPVPSFASYVRVALGNDAAQAVTDEVEYYLRISPRVTRAFEAQQLATRGPEAFGVTGVTGDDLITGLVPYREVLDSCIVRALPPTEDVDVLLAVAEATAPRHWPGPAAVATTS
jgi:alkanesulfonate monooxygenase SsuD/methylene tetrahydromethanopterin reductase-like flavin-dependent oxidoreductase (luciferase family)